eukprot:TRINITY_DN10266_c0_g2_i1.p1 TRINITY_DN10266_c0_g2~~TRINITY_DN10266_c0_g2_i1.p1  ORF type:complete len:477 (-),score=105.32 TRINITY_DN10266_c0_g2_i1:816-2246(-)
MLPRTIVLFSLALQLCACVAIAQAIATKGTNASSSTETNAPIDAINHLIAESNGDEEKNRHDLGPHNILYINNGNKAIHGDLLHAPLQRLFDMNGKAANPNQGDGDQDKAADQDGDQDAKDGKVQKERKADGKRGKRKRLEGNAVDNADADVNAVEKGKAHKDHPRRNKHNEKEDLKDVNEPKDVDHPVNDSKDKDDNQDKDVDQVKKEKDDDDDEDKKGNKKERKDGESKEKKRNKKSGHSSKDSEKKNKDKAKKDKSGSKKKHKGPVIIDNQPKTLPPMKIAFTHIEKTGGTTLRHIFLQHAREMNITKIIPAFQPVTLRAVIKDMDKVADFDIVYGHFTHQFLTKRLCCGYHHFTMVRDPLDRVISGYFYLHRNLDAKKRVPGAPFYNYVLHDSKGIKKDIQCRMLGIRKVEQIPAIVDQFGLVMVTDMFDEGLLLLRDEFQIKNITYLRRKVTQGTPKASEIDPRFKAFVNE